MTNKQLAKQLRGIGNSLFDKTYDPDIKLLLDEASDRLENQSEWISVDEMLPKPFETVLVFCDTGVSKFQCVSEMIEPDGKRWSAVCGFRVTHWMPLPDAPKRKGEGEQ